MFNVFEENKEAARGVREDERRFKADANFWARGDGKQLDATSKNNILQECEEYGWSHTFSVWVQVETLLHSLKIVCGKRGDEASESHATSNCSSVADAWTDLLVGLIPGSTYPACNLHLACSARDCFTILSAWADMHVVVATINLRRSSSMRSRFLSWVGVSNRCIGLICMICTFSGDCLGLKKRQKMFCRCLRPLNFLSHYLTINSLKCWDLPILMLTDNRQ